MLEGGRATGATVHVYGIALDGRVIFDTGAQVRRLALSGLGGGPDPMASQRLGWAGLDVVLWTDFAHALDGEILDDNMLRPADLAGGVVAGFRHFELLVKAEYIWIPEGEKDVESLRKIGLTGTCNAGGALKWTEELNQYLRSDQRITILPDSDTPGRDHAKQVAQSLFGKVASVKVLELAGLPEKGDVSDWLQGRDPEAAAEELP